MQQNPLDSAQNDDERALAQYNLFHVYLQRGANSYPQALDALRVATQLRPDDYALWDSERYRVERILGAGGMGCVFLCRHTLRGQTVALKTLWDDDPQAQQRFRREAQTLADIAGEYVPAANDFGYGDARNKRRLFVEMDYIPDTLDGEAWLETHGPLNREQGIELGLQLAKGLAIAHAQDICHHDLKPANLLIGTTDERLQVKIIDFGLASSVLELQRLHGQSRLSGKSALAQHVFGSFDYAPPEQLGDERYDPPGPKSDIYSFGKTLYRLLTGLSAAHPSYRALRDEPELQDLILECIEPNPSERPDSAEVLVARLQDLATSAQPEIESKPDPVATEQPRSNAPPSIDGWYTDKVQALQLETANKLGLSVVFRDRIKSSGGGFL